MIREQQRQTAPGILMLLIFIAVEAFSVWRLVLAARANSPVQLLLWLPLIVLGGLGLAGLFTLNPNEGKVLQLFGGYAGTVREPGLRWANPFYTKRRVSLRVRNFESAHLKVNDREGNPIEIAAVIVWKVVDTAEALFEVDDYANYVKVQSEAAVRNLASNYAYDTHQEHEMSLRGSTAEVAEHLKKEIQERLTKAGIMVVEARISHLAYAPE